MKLIDLKTSLSKLVTGKLLTLGYFSLESRLLLGALLLLVLSTPSLATHIVGGQLEMVMIDSKAGHFKVTMTYYYNEAQTANLPQPSSNAVIFRKSDGKQMLEFTLPNITISNRPPIVFANPTCALLNNLHISQVIYTSTIQLDPNDYADPQGYYLIQQNCCRNAAITNIVNPQSTPFLFYLEFPPITRSTQLLLNSSPVFKPLIGEYICVGNPFVFSTVASDADDDELHYSLISPLAGTFIVNTNTPVIKPAPYPEVNWKAGYSAQSAIHGNPVLTIDKRTGILTVTASQQGLFVFAILVEEFRNGVKIGEVRRDLQMLVIDCPRSNLPAPAVSIQNQPIGTTVANLCKGKTITLQTTTNNDWIYQWSKNDIPIPGATSPDLTVSESGNYSVSITLASSCSQRISSGNIQLVDASLPAKLLVKGKTSICKNGGLVTLEAPNSGLYTYKWFQNGAELTGQTSPKIDIQQPAQYWAVFHDSAQGCDLFSDTIQITQRPEPLVKITPASATTSLCPGDSLLLTGSGANSYQWNIDGQPIFSAIQSSFYAKAPSTITVTGTDTSGCVTTSTPFTVTSLTNLSITFDSIPILCGVDQPPIQLKGTPIGGKFSGDGVSGDLFYPSKAGIGTHELTYTIQNEVRTCYNGTAHRQAIVGVTPTVDLPPKLIIYKGGDADLHPIITGRVVKFSWQPTTYLTTKNQPDIQALNVEKDIIYTLTVTDEIGCSSTDSVQILVFQRVWIPDAFSPNGDGLNDTWQLNGVETYPQAQLTIFNRWGETIYQTTTGYTNPFDGTYAGQPIPTGVYPYIFCPSPNLPLMKGVVLLTR